MTKGKTGPSTRIGIEASDPSPFARWAMSRLIRVMVGEKRRRRQRARAEFRRRLTGKPHVIEYFHQVDDGYSHLAAQTLKPLLDTYEVRLICHLVRGPRPPMAPEPELLLSLSRYDAAQVASHYGLRFPAEAGTPGAPSQFDGGLVDAATRILAGLDASDLPTVAPQVGAALWSNSTQDMAGLATEFGRESPEGAEQRLDHGDAELSRLGHYSGGMFRYGGEWYWGVDRLHHLEQRLIDVGAKRPDAATTGLLFPRPSIAAGPHRDDGSLTLEIYPSARSPYTAASFDAAVALAKATGVTLAVRPVLPMVMRGLSVPRQKGMYIFMDASREARTLNPDAPWGKVCDPIGGPVRRCYSLFPWARDQGRGTELLSAFMSHAFRQGVNANKDAGLKRIVEAAGLSWTDARHVVDNEDWHEEIEANRQAMYDVGLWGVPSFHLFRTSAAAATDSQDRRETLLAVWGQDRLWLVSRAIQAALNEPGIRSD